MRGKPGIFPLNPTHQTLGAAAGAVLVAALLARVLYLPALAKIGMRWTALQGLKAKIAEARLLSQELPDQEAALAGVRARYAVLEQRMDADQSVARILDSLSQEAKAHRLDLVAVQPGEEEDKPRLVRLGPKLILREIPLNLELTGSYRHVGEFLGTLPAAPFLSSVRRLSVTKPQADSAKLKADLALAVYLAEEVPHP